MTPERLRPVLEREHRQWIQEVVGLIEAASRSDAGVWARWNALRYLQTTFPERLDRERRLVEGMMADLTDDQREILWALGGLLEALRLRLDHLVGLCHQAPQFALVTGQIVTTLRHWCRAVEEGLGPRAIAVMPRQSREVLALIDPEFAAAGRACSDDQAPAATASATLEPPLATASSSASASAATAPITVTTGF
jgi:hypothetical protein